MMPYGERLILATLCAEQTTTGARPLGNRKDSLRLSRAIDGKPCYSAFFSCQLKAFSAFDFDVVGDFVDLVKDVAVAIYEVRDLGGCVHNGRVVPAAEGASDLRERLVGEFTAEVHGDLPGVGECLRAASTDEVCLRDAEVTADLVLDQLYRDFSVRCI